jgi:hypothetical protein
MPVPIICLDENVCHFAERFRQLLSKPQYQYFVIVLLGLMQCEGGRTAAAACCVRSARDRAWQD